MASTLLQSLPRRDQRGKGAEYLAGLLQTTGRKSVRNIAATSASSATEQSLHHFISDSTWDWRPMRRALTRYVLASMPVQAWVLRPMTIVKAGSHSVGVSRRFCAEVGQSLNVQQSVGLWAVGQDLSSPVNWRLHLTSAWLQDNRRRRSVEIPDDERLETLGECAARTYLDARAGVVGFPTRPVVFDARDTDVAPVLDLLGAAGTPFVLRIPNSYPLSPADPALPGHLGGSLSAQEIMAAARGNRCPVYLRDAEGNLDQTWLAGMVRVRLPRSGTVRTPPRELMLLGAGRLGGSWPTELWLTDLVEAGPAPVLQLAGLLRQVDRDFAEIADEVGIRDYAGRSFNGWHRHATLASAAHAVAMLTDPSRDAARYAS
ncbi:MAG TPA: transposase [Jatrophihabitans sp.]|nr:transposase [Jatrophihabitans sp.]